MPLRLIISPPHNDSISPLPNTLSPNFNLCPSIRFEGTNPHTSFPLTPPASNPNHLSPNPFNLKIKANSLPSILDSDNEEERSSSKKIEDDSSKSPTSTGWHNLLLHFMYSNWPS